LVGGGTPGVMGWWWQHGDKIIGGGAQWH